jgi:SAM-dependent methyltransferase
MTSRLFALILACFTFLAASADDTEAWAHFIGWYKTYTGSPMPPDFIAAYSAELQRSGLSAEEAKTRLAQVRKGFATNQQELLSVNFSNIYRNHASLFSQEPNALLARTVRSIRPGRALDVGMGKGRNSIYLAKLGWDVAGYDLSDDGLAIARANAAKEGVRISAVKALHQQYDFGQNRWDLIVLTYSFVDFEDAAMVRKLTESLAPGGLIVVEQFNSGSEAKGPANALFKTFATPRVIHYEDIVDTADWTKKPARLGRLVAQKDALPEQPQAPSGLR